LDPWPCKARHEASRELWRADREPGVVGTRESHQGIFQAAASGPPFTMSVEPNFSSVAAVVATAAILSTAEV